jgi:hypothetical protein
MWLLIVQSSLQDLPREMTCPLSSHLSQEVGKHVIDH